MMTNFCGGTEFDKRDVGSAVHGHSARCCSSCKFILGRTTRIGFATSPWVRSPLPPGTHVNMRTDFEPQARCPSAIEIERIIR
jgi:hypothetical protein